MTSTQQRAALQSQIWKIANDVRGAVDGWDFKQYVLGTLFYRFISENFASYIEGGDDSIHYAELADKVITPDIKDDAIKTKGYFIYPSQLFATIAANANNNESLNTDLAAVFASIESSANGYPSERDIKGLFADFDTTSNRLGNTVADKNTRLAAVLKGVDGLEFGDFEGSHIDLFGDAYEFLISNYAANAGKSGGEFFTPQHVSRLIAQLAMHKQTRVNKIYDPACGSGSLLLQAKKHFDAHIIEDGFWGQEINHTTYNLARMNMFLHNINYDKFNIQLGDTLGNPQFWDDKPFDAIVSNPPYSLKWIGSDDPTLINDERFAPAGVLAPKSKADFAFVLHALSYLSSKGRAAIVCFPGIFYRGGAEQKIRQYLVDNNYVETVISLASNLFYGTSIAVNILVLSKHKTDTKTQFIDASGPDYFKKDINNNVLLNTHIEQIMEVFDSKKNVDHFAQSVPFEQVVANGYNLSVSSYVKTKDVRERVKIAELKFEIENQVNRIDWLRSEINAIVGEIEGSEAAPLGNLDFLEKLLKDVSVEWRALGDIGTFVRGKRFVKTDLVSEGVPCIHYGEMYTHYGVWATKAKSFIDPALASKLRTAKNGDVVIVAAGETIEDIGNGTAWLGDDSVVIHDACFAYSSQLNPKYLSYFLRTELCKGQIRKHVSSGKISSINSTGLSKAKVPIPCPGNHKKSLEIQEKIVCVLDKFDELTAELTSLLAAELEARKKQHLYYRAQLLKLPMPDDIEA